jgi:hypothetical protein
VFVIDSASPERGRAEASNGIKGKRKASPLSTTTTSAASTATAKRRKKDGEPLLVPPPAPLSSNYNKAKVDLGRPGYPPDYPPTRHNLPFYRGGYDADHSYQSPNGTRWTDSVDNVSDIGMQARRVKAD